MFNVIIRVYSILYSSHGKLNLMLSPMRFLWRKLANVLQPRWLRRSLQTCRVGEQTLQNGERIVVSLTSFPARINDVWQVVACMLAQTLQPTKVILWLSKEQFASKDALPQSLLSLEDETFSIRLVDGDLRSHKKHYYAFREYPGDLVVIIDDDLYYPTDMLAKLYEAHCQNPAAVVCRYAYQMRYAPDGTVKPYAQWGKVMGASTSGQLFFGSGGGTLFQPARLYPDISRKDLFTRLTPQADDIWLNAMTRLADIPIVKIPCGLILPVFIAQNVTLAATNLYENRNDAQLQDVQSYYAEEIGRRPFVP